MGLFRKLFHYLFLLVSILLILVSLLSLIEDLALWYAKILDFPRLQYLVLGIICFILCLSLGKGWKPWNILLCLGLLGVVVIQSTRILPYFIGNKTVPSSSSEGIKERTVGIMIANVLMKNRNEKEFLQLVENTDPEMLLVMEVDQWWVEQLQPLKREYPYFVEYPLDNTFGIALYSKLPLKGEEVSFLTDRRLPSIHTRVSLGTGEEIMFYGIHPVPPLPKWHGGETHEAALLRVGELVVENRLASIVAGDYNAVSWSNTAQLFSSKGNLENVRLGRGLYNSFNAKSIIMRWPLDHYFVTPEFMLKELERLPEFGSDHFAMYAELVLRASSD